MTELNVILETPTHKITSAGTPVTDSRTSLPIGSTNVLVNQENALQSLTGDYIANLGDSIDLTAEILYGSHISYPNVVLKMPVVRYADGVATDDEIYFNTSIIDGVMTASGTFPRSGDWKFISSRINQALLRAGASWKIEMETLSILV